MRIAISSQNFRTVTGHAGKARRFMLYDIDAAQQVQAAGRLDLPLDQAMHGFDDRQTHPLDNATYLITASAGEGFMRRMAQRGVRVVTTAETDPEVAIHAFLMGCLKPPGPHERTPHDHKEGGECGCSCSG
jgi:predicted Fe-Mo cluster-binding NifX family protein